MLENHLNTKGKSKEGKTIGQMDRGMDGQVDEWTDRQKMDSPKQREIIHSKTDYMGTLLCPLYHTYSPIIKRVEANGDSPASLIALQL